MKDPIFTEFSEILSNFPGMVFYSKDADSSSDSHIENIENLTGYSADEIQKRQYGWQSLIFDEDLPYYRKKLDELEHNPEKDYLEIEYRINKKNGRTVYLLEKIKVIRDSDGRIAKRSGVMIDLTNYRNEINLLRTEISRRFRKKIKLNMLNLFMIHLTISSDL